MGLDLQPVRSTPEAVDFVDELYRRIITAGTHRAPSIKGAEGAKVIENTERDANIALMNELAILFGKLGIDTHDVLAAAGTTWNFPRVTPGLVGGHCIGVDPYYLTTRPSRWPSPEMTTNGTNPQLLSMGRRTARDQSAPGRDNPKGVRYGGIG